MNDPSPELEKFKEEHNKRLGIAPGFTAMEGYETMQLLARGLEETDGHAINLGNALIGIQDYVGLTGPVKLDAYGDALRVLSIQKIVDGKFVTIRKLDMTEK
ncbi:ABC transporter substrate-binding protein [bacterium]|nr:ABC transporter substrate-binding protein [bacterium]